MAQTQQKLYTVTVFSENCVGLLNQISIIYTRRCLNINSVSSSMCSLEGVHKLTLTTFSDRVTMEKVVKQIEKRIDVIKAFLYTDDDIVYQEVALYKVPTCNLINEQNLEGIIRGHNARILEITSDYTVLEKTGQLYETQALYEELKRYGVRQFSRSGRVLVTKSPCELVDRWLDMQEGRRRRQLESPEV